MRRKYYVVYSWIAQNGGIQKTWMFAEILVDSPDEGLTQQTIENMLVEFRRRENAREGSVIIDFIFPLVDLAQ